jgi:NAD(P)-dependent dehydrogenase (short-subunit alcohol dehydrogenase family)
MAEDPPEIQKVALVTGGSRGLGLEMARILARRGWALALVARDPAGLESARRLLARESPSAPSLSIACDLGRSGSARSAVEACKGAFGRLDLLVNNAGAISPAPFASLSRDTIATSLDLHVLAPAEAMGAAFPLLSAGRRGRVINVSAIEGLVGVPLLAACASGKFGLVGLTESVRAEWASKGVGVTLACPGFLRPAGGSGISPKAAPRPPSNRLPGGADRWMHLPLLSMEVDRAAARILEASERGRPRIVLTPAARALALLHGVAPGLVARVASRVGGRLWRDPEIRG